MFDTGPIFGGKRDGALCDMDKNVDGQKHSSLPRNSVNYGITILLLDPMLYNFFTAIIFDGSVKLQCLSFLRP